MKLAQVLHVRIQALERRWKMSVVDEKDFSKPIVRRKIVQVENISGMASVVDFGETGEFTFDEPVAHGGTGLGPTPLQGVLACLCSCEAVTFNRTAAEFGFKYEGISFDSEFTIDIRGRQGVRSVVPHFQTIRVEARVKTNESEENLRKVVEETEARCPVFNLLKDANVKVNMVWIRTAILSGNS